MGAAEVSSFVRSYEVEEPRYEDTLPGVALLPDGGLLTKLVLSRGPIEQSILKIAAKAAPFYPAPHAGSQVRIVVHGAKGHPDFALDYLTACWPEPIILKVPVLVARNDIVSIAASQPCTVVLFGIEKLDVR